MDLICFNSAPDRIQSHFLALLEIQYASGLIPCVDAGQRAVGSGPNAPDLSPPNPSARFMTRPPSFSRARDVALKEVFGRVLYSPHQNKTVTVSTLYTVRPLKQHFQFQLNVITEQFWVNGNWALNCVHYVHGAERSKEEEVLTEGQRASQGRAFLCFTKDVIDPCVYYYK